MSNHVRLRYQRVAESEAWKESPSNPFGTIPRGPLAPIGCFGFSEGELRLLILAHSARRQDVDNTLNRFGFE